jgi:hypothetical protein
MFSRLIVAYEVWEEETSEHAEHLINGVSRIAQFIIKHLKRV